MLRQTGIYVVLVIEKLEDNVILESQCKEAVQWKILCLGFRISLIIEVNDCYDQRHLYRLQWESFFQEKIEDGMIRLNYWAAFTQEVISSVIC